MTTVFNNDGHGNFWIITWCKGCKKCVISELKISFMAFLSAVLFFESYDLCCSCFATNIKIRNTRAVISRATRFINNLPQSLFYILKCCWIQLYFSYKFRIKFFQNLAMRVFNSLNKIGFIEFTFIANGRIHVCQLKCCNKVKSLTNG